MTPVETTFWQRLVRGELRSPRAFFAALREQRAEAEALPPDRFFGVPDDPAHFAAFQRLRVGDAYFTIDAYLRQHNRADWQHVDPRMRLFAARLLEALRKRGIPFYVHGAFRTRSEQNAAFSAGRSKMRWPFAAHCQGAAVDIVSAQFHWDLSRQEWSAVGNIGKQIAASMSLPLVWGGDWSFYDPAHWELPDWRSSVQELEAGEPVRLTPRGILRLSG